MTPDDRRALADRLDHLANQAKQLQVYGISMDLPKRDAPLFAEAAAALRDAEGQIAALIGLGRSIETTLTAERDAARAEAARLRKGIEELNDEAARLGSWVRASEALWALLDDEGTGRE